MPADHPTQNPADAVSAAPVGANVVDNAAPSMSVAGEEPGWGVVQTIAMDGPRGLALGDVDGDGDDDLVFTSYSGNTVLWSAYDAGSFGAPQVVDADIASPYDLAVGDIDGDGKAEIVAGSYGGDTVSLYTANASGGFDEIEIGSVDNPRAIKLADLDGDGDLDALVAGYNADEVVWYQNTGGTFGAAQSLGALDGASDLVVVDFDGDGDLDVLATGAGANTVQYFESQGDGTFAEGVTVAEGQSLRGLAVGDLDGDGDNDIVVTGYTSDEVVVFRNEGDGTFDEGTVIATPDGPNAVSLVDVDGDGDLDVVTSGYLGNDVTVSENLGDGTFAEAETILGEEDTTRPWTTLPAEIDGTPSLVVSGFTSDSVQILQHAAGTVSVNADRASAVTGLVFEDEDAAGDITVTLEVSAGVLSAEADGSVAVEGGGTATLTLSGSVADINAFVAAGAVAATVPSGASASISVTIDDGSGAENAVQTALVLVDVDEAPVAIALSNDTIAESARTGATVGTLSASDPEGEAITFALVDGEGDNNRFALRDGDDGSVSVVLRSPLDHEDSDGVYDLVVKATDSNGNETVETLAVTVADDPFKLSSAPTGKSYTSIVESAPAGTEIGFVTAFDDSFEPVSAELVDDAGGLFSIATREVGGELRYYLTVDGALDHETADRHAVTIRATDAAGTTHDKTFEVHVLDAPEPGDTARGAITIDAGNGEAGVDWATYLEDVYNQVSGSFPGGVAFAPDTSSEYLYGFGDDSYMSLKGADLAYWWSDPATGEDVHVVAGSIGSLTFGDTLDGDNAIVDPELSITGLDLSNDVDLMARIYGETNLTALTYMYGPNGATPGDIEAVKAFIGSYAQNFIGSAGADNYVGTAFDDTVTGGAGDDTISAGAGEDVVVFTGNAADYTIVANDDGTVTVTDLVADRDGTDTLTSVESLQFADTVVALEGTGPTVEVASEGPAFTDSLAVATPRGIIPVKTADVDGDGDVDLLGRTSLGETPGIYWFENDGEGNFSAGELVTEVNSWRFEVADIDGDGLTDVLTADPVNSATLWHRNNGDGTFSDGVAIGDGRPNTIAVADVEGDGDADVLAALTSDGAVVLHRQNGNGSFTSETVDAAFENVVGAALGDLDGDGTAEIVATGGNGSELRVYTAGEDGGYGLTNTVDLAATLGLAYGAETVKLADIDGDGKLDALAISANDKGIYLLKGNGDGTFSDLRVVAEGETGATDLEIADVDGDGRLDIVAPSTTTTEEGTGTLSWFQQQDDGSFVEHRAEGTVHATTAEFNEIEVADIDGDGSLDLVSSGQASEGDGSQSYLRVSRGLPSLSVDENKATAITGLTFDAVAGLEVRVVLGTDRGTLAATGTENVTVSGEGDMLTLTGTAEDLNAFVAGGNLTFLTDAYDETGAVLSVTVDDQNAADPHADTAELILAVVPEDDAPPTDIAIDNATIAEDAPLYTAVGTLSATDPEGQAVTFSLVSDAGGAFIVSGDTLYLSGAIDHETADTLDIVVRATDIGGESTDQTITIAVGDVNEAPSAIALSDDKVVEGAAAGTVVGTFTTTDPDDGDTFTYTILDDTGAFEIVGDELRVKDLGDVLNPEVTIVATDAGGLSTEETFKLRSTDENGAPLGSEGTIVVDASTASEGIDLQAFVRGGFISDAVGGGFPVFDNGSAFEGAEMFIGYGAEATSKYVLADGRLEYFFDTHTVAGTIDRIQFGARGAGTFDEQGAFAGGDAELTITGLNLSNPIPGNAEEEEAIEATGPVHNFALAYMYGASAEQDRLDIFADALAEYHQSIVGSAFGDTLEGGAFGDTIDGGAGGDLLLGGGGDDVLIGGAGSDSVDGGEGDDTFVLDGSRADYDVYFYDSTYIVAKDTGDTDALTNVETVRFDDGSIDVATGVENAAPTDLSLSGDRSVAEDAPAGTVVGTLSANDPDGDPLTYTLTADAGGLFALTGEGDTVHVVLAGALDHATAQSHAITVEVMDGAGNTTTETFDIAVEEMTDPGDNMITINASNAAEMNFQAFLTSGFFEGASGSGFPTFDNSAAFEGEEMYMSYGNDATSPYFLAHGEIGYFFNTHTVHGTVNRIEFGTVGNGTFDENGYFENGDVALEITGLDFFNGTEPEEEVEATGPVHNFASAYMSGVEADQDRIALFMDQLDGYAQHYIGSAGADVFSASNNDDSIEGGAGNDALDGLGGDDIINGGAGDDTITAGDGDDRVFAGAGDDLVLNGGGTMRAFGATGDDTLIGGSENDTLMGGQGNDVIGGGGGADRLNGGAGNDSLDGNAGDDVLFGAQGDDVLFGSGGADRLVGGAGDDELDGGDGNDVLNGGAGNDILTGGEGADTFNFAGSFGFDTITDFLLGTDQIVIQGAEADDVTIDHGGSETILSIGEDRGIAFGTVINDLDVSDLMFV